MATNPEALEVIPPSTVPGEKKTAAGPGPVYRYDDYDEDIQGEYPTEEEFHSLRRVSDKIPFAIYTIAFIELCERFSYYGTTVVCKLIISYPLEASLSLRCLVFPYRGCIISFAVRD